MINWLVDICDPAEERTDPSAQEVRNDSWDSWPRLSPRFSRPARIYCAPPISGDVARAVKLTAGQSNRHRRTVGVRQSQDVIALDAFERDMLCYVLPSTTNPNAGQSRYRLWLRTGPSQNLRDAAGELIEGGRSNE